MAESERLTFQTDLGVSIDKNEDCPTCSICWACDIKVKDCKYFNDVVEKLAKYEALGTVEELQTLKAKSENIKALEKEAYNRGWKDCDREQDEQYERKSRYPWI